MMAGQWAEQRADSTAERKVDPKVCRMAETMAEQRVDRKAE